MKIVCEACQAKYSISDDKVRGKAFKIRCKKCSHIIVVRSADGTASSTSSGSNPAIVAVPPADNSWHIVVDGEQVGPLSASDIRGRLSRGELNGETYIWREGLADWLKVSAVPEFAGQGEDEGGSPFPSAPAANAYPPGTAEGAFAAPASEADVFASPTHVSSSMSADLFASPSSASEPEKAPAASSYSSGYGGGSSESASLRGGGNGAAMASSSSSLTGQRHENSVLFSLSNLEALASPNQPGSSAPRPGISSGPSEGSGLIDIRSMAAMTLGSTAESRSTNDLPTFGAPQFSPMAPVLLPIGGSGPPKWLYAVLGLLFLLAGSLAFVTYKFLTTRNAVATRPAPAPVAAPVATAPPVKPAPTTTAPPTTPLPAANEALPPRDEKPAAERPAAPRGPRPASRTARAPKGPRGGDLPSGVAVAPTPPPTAEKPVKQDKLDELLSSAMGNKPKPAARQAEEEPAARKPAAAALPDLGKEEIVRAMMGVQSKVKDCFNQYKVPGTAMVSMNVARGGRITSTSVTGKFAGTPTGACVAAAVKTAKFPPCEAKDGLAYPFALH